MWKFCEQIQCFFHVFVFPGDVSLLLRMSTLLLLLRTVHTHSNLKQSGASIEQGGLVFKDEKYIHGHSGNDEVCNSNASQRFKYDFLKRK